MLLLSAKSESWEKMNAFFLETHEIRLKRNVSLKMIMQKKTRQLKKRIKEREEIGLIEIRVSDFDTDAEILVTSEYIAILDISSKNKIPCGFMIKNPVFVSLFRQVYGFLWNNVS